MDKLLQEMSMVQVESRSTIVLSAAVQFPPLTILTGGVSEPISEEL
jgi:hypothetical protein